MFPRRVLPGTVEGELHRIKTPVQFWTGVFFSADHHLDLVAVGSSLDAENEKTRSGHDLSGFTAKYLVGLFSL